MEQNTDENLSLEEQAKKEKKYKGLTKFFESDMQIKQTLFKIAPTEKDDFNEESRMKYADEMYKELRDFKSDFLGMVRSMELGENVERAVKDYFNKAKKGFFIRNYEAGVPQKLYRAQFSDMNPQLIEKVKKECCGYTWGANLEGLINSSGSINDLLHVMHSYVINNENILQAMPVISTRKMGYYPLTLYGEETELSRKIFEEFPTELDCGWTEIVSMKDKILMMVRDRGHALTIEMDTSDAERNFVRYFVPKLCNEGMIRALPGVNLSGITDNGATGAFVTLKEESVSKLFEFIGKVPTDMDMGNPWTDEVHYDSVEPKIQQVEETANPIFESQDVKELANMKGDEGRKTSELKGIQNKIKNAIKGLKDKMVGKKSSQMGENSNDESIRD